MAQDTRVPWRDDHLSTTAQEAAGRGLREESYHEVGTEDDDGALNRETWMDEVVPSVGAQTEVVDQVDHSAWDQEVAFLEICEESS